jgi:hypothetical protein
MNALSADDDFEDTASIGEFSSQNAALLAWDLNETPYLELDFDPADDADDEGLT